MDLQDLQRIFDEHSITIISTFLVIFLGILCYLKGRGQPPGPWGLPYLGYWPFMKYEEAHLRLQSLMKKYGDVYTFNYVGQLYIHLGTIKAIKEAHVTKSDCFTDRLSKFNLLDEIFGGGIVSANGEKWKIFRKFLIQSFREYGLTAMKDYMSGPMNDSLTATVDKLRAQNGKPVNIISILTMQCSVILRRMMFKDHDISDEELVEILETYKRVFPIFVGSKQLLAGEFARLVILPFQSDYRIAMRNLKPFRAVLKKIIRRHEAKFDPDSIGDLIDSYIKERNNRRSRNDPTAQYFTESALIASLTQLIGDGVEGVAVFIAYFINALLDHPEEQEKVYKEIEDVIGPNRQPTVEDKNKLPYTNALILEVIRMMNFLPFIASLECTKETTLNGYKIPKGAVTVMNVWSAHHDPKVFEKPYDFNPSRYMTQPGKQKAELPIIFGIGKRSCLGESYTMMQVFLFLVALIKNFRLQRPKGSKDDFLLYGLMELHAIPRKP